MMQATSVLSTALVASSLPPRPVSRMMKFTPLLRKWRRATASASSKKVGGCSQPSASCFRKKISSASASGGIIFPFTRMRSENSTRWGEVNRPVTYPLCPGQGLNHGAGGAFPVGASHVDHCGIRPVRIGCRQQLPGIVKPQLDPEELGGKKPVKGGGHVHGRYSTTGRLPFNPGMGGGRQ